MSQDDALRRAEALRRSREAVVPIMERLLDGDRGPGAPTDKAMPDIASLHRAVHELLPKPNQGLWEPELGLDHFLLSYLVLLQQNAHWRAKHEHRSGAAKAATADAQEPPPRARL